MFRHFIVPIFLSGCKYQEMHLMPDGAPRHFTFPVCACLYSHFCVGWIGRDGPIDWPPREVAVLLQVVFVR